MFVDILSTQSHRNPSNARFPVDRENARQGALIHGSILVTMYFPHLQEDDPNLDSIHDECSTASRSVSVASQQPDRIRERDHFRLAFVLLKLQLNPLKMGRSFRFVHGPAGNTGL